MGLESNEYEEWFLGFDHDDVFILGHVHKYLLDFSPLWTFGMSAIKLSVTIRKEIITILDTVKFCMEEWPLSGRK